MFLSREAGRDFRVIIVPEYSICPFAHCPVRVPSQLNQVAPILMQDA